MVRKLILAILVSCLMIPAFAPTKVYEEPDPVELADVNDDTIVDIYDAVTLASCYGAVEGDARYRAECDINPVDGPYFDEEEMKMYWIVGDGVIDIYDVVALCAVYGEIVN